MRKAITTGVICVGAAVVLLAADKVQPLNVKTGLWQMTQTITWTGLPPQMAAMMKNARPVNYKSCVKEKDLSTNPWASGSEEKCTWTALKSNGTDMDVQATSCEMGKEWGMTSDVHGTIHVLDSENGTGKFDITMTGNGQTMKGHATYIGKWVAGSCPADMN